MRIGKTIQHLRKERHLTQAQLANALQLGRTTIANYENDYSCPDLETLIVLSRYFNVTTDYLLSYDQSDNSLPPQRDYDRFWYYFNRLNLENRDLIVGEMIRLYKKQN